MNAALSGATHRCFSLSLPPPPPFLCFSPSSPIPLSLQKNNKTKTQFRRLYSGCLVSAQQMRAWSSKRMSSISIKHTRETHYSQEPSEPNVNEPGTISVSCFAGREAGEPALPTRSKPWDL